MIRFEILKAIWDVPGKNNIDENNNDATLLAKILVYRYIKNWNEWDDHNRKRDVSNTIFNKFCIFQKHNYLMIEIPKML